MGDAAEFERKVETVVLNVQTMFLLFGIIDFLKGLVTVVARVNRFFPLSRFEKSQRFVYK